MLAEVKIEAAVRKKINEKPNTELTDYG